MITFLIYIFFKKYHNHRWAETGLQIRKLLRSHSQIIFLGLLAILLALIPISSKAQNLGLNYKIIQAGDNIGSFSLKKPLPGNAEEEKLTCLLLALTF